MPRWPTTPSREHGMRVILCGGTHARWSGKRARPSKRRLKSPIVNQIGKDTLPQMLALLERATVPRSRPDSGPAHMATMVRTPVVGLYAATNPSAVARISRDSGA